MPLSKRYLVVIYESVMNSKIHQIAEECVKYHYCVNGQELADWFDYEEFATRLANEFFQHLTDTGHDRAREVLEKYFNKDQP